VPRAAGFPPLLAWELFAQGWPEGPLVWPFWLFWEHPLTEVSRRAPSGRQGFSERYDACEALPLSP
jgi:hypothetical protein